MAKKNNDKANRPWYHPFEKACRKYIFPIMKKRFKIKFSTINAESQIACISENICYKIYFDVSSFPRLFVTDGRQMNSKRITSKEISTGLVQLEKEYNKIISVGTLTKWMRESQEGKYDQYIVEGVKIIADYLKEKIEE